MYLEVPIGLWDLKNAATSASLFSKSMAELLSFVVLGTWAATQLGVRRKPVLIKVESLVGRRKFRKSGFCTGFCTILAFLSGFFFNSFLRLILVIWKLVSVADDPTVSSTSSKSSTAHRKSFFFLYISSSWTSSFDF